MVLACAACAADDSAQADDTGVAAGASSADDPGQGDLLVNESERGLAVVAARLASGAPLTLASKERCTAARPGCGWLFRNGMLVSSANTQLAVEVQGTARRGAPLVLSADCTAEQERCRFAYVDGELRSALDPRFVINGLNGEYQGAALVLDDKCVHGSGDCGWVRPGAPKRR
jgi:hypothetical protein